MEGTQIDRTPIGSGSLLQFKKSLTQNASPRSPLSPESPSCDSIDLAIDDALGSNSIEQLYQNIYEMKSSDQSSPYICSYTTYGNESRIDAELCHLVGTDMDEEVLEKQKKKNSGTKVKGNIDSSPPPLRSPSPSSQGKEKVAKTKKLARAKKDRPTKAMSSNPAVLWIPPFRGTGGKTNSHEKPPVAKTKTKSTRNLRKASLDGPVEAKSTEQNSGEDTLEMGTNNPDLGPYLLKKAKDMISADNAKKAFDLLMRAKKSFENFSNEKPNNLDFVLCLHFLASIHCSCGQYEEAIPLLQRSISIPDVEMGQDHALAKFAGLMQLGDIYAVLGHTESSINLYKDALEVQKGALGENDASFGDTCRYVAEAHVQALRFDDAEKLCQMALNSHKKDAHSSVPVSIEEGADRRLMGLICDSKGDYEGALENYSLASLALSFHGQDLDTAAINCNVGDAFLALSRYDEAVCSYKKSLEVFKLSKGENHPSVASMFVRLAELYNKVGKLGQSKFYCEKALRIYIKPLPGVPAEEIASGMINLASIFESMNELKRAINLLQRALEIYRSQEGSSQESTIAGIEAQIGLMHYMLGNYGDSYCYLKTAANKLQLCGDNSALYGIALNQMGLACIHLDDITEATVLFEEAKGILENAYGPCHPETLAVCSNLAGTYDALGRWDEAIEILDFVVGVREEKLGTADPIVDDEKKRLTEMLKEAGRVRHKNARSLENLLDIFSEIAAKAEST